MARSLRCRPHGAVHLTELAREHMVARHGGAIVYVSSISGRIGQGVEHGYVAMKAALSAAAKRSESP